MPNDLTAERNLLNWRDGVSHIGVSRTGASESQRQKLASSSFTVSIWTLSGVVLVACGSLEEFLGIDDGDSGGGRSVHVQKSPVQGARIYFDVNEDGAVSAEEMAAQDALYPEGFISDETGRVPGIPANFYGKKFEAHLDGAFDAETGEALSDDIYESIPDANGQHTLASPITDFIAKQTGATEAVIMGILDPNANGEADIAEFREQILDPASYLESGSLVEALAVYVDTQSRTEDQVQGEIMRHLPETTPADTLEILNTDTNTITPIVELDGVTISPHNVYVATVEAVNSASAGVARYSFVEPDGNGGYTPVSSDVFAINARGVISVIDGATLTTTTLYVAVTNDAETEYASIVVTVADLASTPELTAPATTTATVAENDMGEDLIMGIGASGASVDEWVVRAPGDLSSKFEIMQDGGNYKLALASGESLDFEAIPNGVLDLEVWGKTSDGVRSNTLKFTITVTDANDAPVFLVATEDNGLTDGTETIAENAGAGAVVAQVRAADADTSGANGAVTYAITGGTGMGVFDIDNNGAIRVAVGVVLDYDTAPTSYTLTITASDGAGATATQDITIMLIDANDIMPAVVVTSGTGRARTTGNDDASSNPAANTGYSITITDADTDNQFAFSVSDRRFAFEETSAGSGVWNLRLRAGQAVTEAEGGEITLTYQVSDGVHTLPPSTITLNVVDSPVMFAPVPAGDLDFAENDATWTLSLSASSSDESGASVDITTYMLLDANGDAVASHGGFEIVTTGALGSRAATISLASGFDFETDGARQTFRVQATDENGETATIPLTVNVADLNDETPVLTSAESTYNIDEVTAPSNAPQGLGIMLTTADADAGTTFTPGQFTITGDSRFEVIGSGNSWELALSAGESLNYETPADRSISLTITVADAASGGNISTALPLTINVDDVNDVVPAVDAPMGRTIRTTTGNANNMDTGYQITITDADTNNVFNVNVDDPRFIFERAGATNTWDLVLLANQAVSAGTITLGYSGTDGANPISGTITLEATDSSVSFAAGMGTRAVDVIENDASASVASVTATSTEAGTISYALTSATAADGSDASSLFNFDTATGAITLASALDYEFSAQYRLVITATNAGDSNEAPATITINVGNVDEAGRRSYEVVAPATLAVGSELTAQRVANSDEDPDGVDESSIEYQWLRDGTPIADANGQTYTLVTGDDVNAIYSVQVSYLDGYNAGLDPDDQMRTMVEASTSSIKFSQYSLDVPENQAEGVNFARLMASVDGATGHYISFVFVRPDDTVRHSDSFGIFTLDHSGLTTEADLRLAVGATLDYETTSSYTRTIRLTYDADGNSGTEDDQETRDVVVTINVLDVNDAPVFTAGQTTTAMIYESRTAVDGTILMITADDADGTAPNNQVRYSITAGNTDDVFFIDPISGAIRVADNAVLNYDTDPATTEYRLEITASDGGDNPPTETVTITLMDVNDIVPMVEVTSAEGTVRTTGTAGASSNAAVSTGYRIQITDADTDNRFTFNVSDPRFEFRDLGNGFWELYIKAGQAVTEAEAATLTINYQVNDGVNDAPTSGTATIKVVDSPVRFVSPSNTVRNEDENNKASEFVAFVAANSNDDFIASYELVDANGMAVTGGIFTLTEDGSGGEKAARIRVADANALDFETTSSYTIYVRATDVNGETNILPLTINVNNVEEGDAVYEVTASDSTLAAGTILTASVAAGLEDPDGVMAGSIEYQWLADGVEISGAEGQTYTLVASDDVNAVYTVQVSYLDNYNAGLDLDDQMRTEVVAGISPIKLAGAPYTGSINEDRTMSNLPTIMASVDDSLTGGIRYDIVGDAQGFKINSSSGKLLLRVDADYETTPTVTLTVRVTYDADRDGATTDDQETRYVQVVIDIGNVEEGDAVYEITQSDTTLAVGTILTASVAANMDDPDGVMAGSIEYQWFADGVEIDGATGSTYTIAGSVAGYYDVRVSYLDGYNAALPTADQTRSVVVASTSPIKFSAPIYTGSINEDGTMRDLPTIMASVDNAPAGHAIKYVFAPSGGGTSNADQGFFIHENSGVIIRVGKLDYETATSHTLTVRVTYDSNGDTAGGDVHTRDVQVVINVNDVEEVKFSAPSYTGSVNEDGTAPNLPTISGSVDSPAQGSSIIYYFMHSDGDIEPTDRGFRIDTNDGSISVVGDLDYETTSRYELTVRAIYDEDGDFDTTMNDQLIGDVQVVINVNDVDESSPAKIPNRQEPIAHDPYDPYDPDDDLGLTPMPDTNSDAS